MDAHAHRQTAGARSRGRLTATLVLTCGFLVVEVAGALWSGSLALLADAGHMLADAGGLALALFAIWIAGRPPTPAKTYGYYRVEILAAFTNSVVLIAVSLLILYEAWERLRNPPAGSSSRPIAVCWHRRRFSGAPCSRWPPSGWW